VRGRGVERDEHASTEGARDKRTSSAATRNVELLAKLDTFFNILLKCLLNFLEPKFEKHFLVYI